MRKKKTIMFLCLFLSIWHSFYIYVFFTRISQGIILNFLIMVLLIKGAFLESYVGIVEEC